MGAGEFIPSFYFLSVTLSLSLSLSLSFSFFSSIALIKQQTIQETHRHTVNVDSLIYQVSSLMMTDDEADRLSCSPPTQVRAESDTKFAPKLPRADREGMEKVSRSLSPLFFSSLCLFLSLSFSLISPHLPGEPAHQPLSAGT